MKDFNTIDVRDYLDQEIKIGSLVIFVGNPIFMLADLVKGSLLVGTVIKFADTASTIQIQNKSQRQVVYADDVVCLDYLTIEQMLTHDMEQVRKYGLARNTKEIS